jgi:hypothetical protein
MMSYMPQRLLGPGLVVAASSCLATLVPVAAQSTACPIADDSTVSQAVGSPMAGKVEVTATPSRSMWTTARMHGQR